MPVYANIKQVITSNQPGCNNDCYDEVHRNSCYDEAGRTFKNLAVRQGKVKARLRSKDKARLM